MNQTVHRRIATLEITLPAQTNLKGARGRALDAALRLFAEKGFGGTSVRDLCQAAGVQPATLYAHFPAKEHVLAELITLAYEELYRSLRTAVLESSADPVQQLTALVRSHVLSHCEFSMLAVVASAELHMLSSDLSAPILTLKAQSEALLADVLQRGSKLGCFELDDYYLVLRAISGMGLRVAYWYSPELEKSPAQIADSFARYACRIAGVRADVAE